MREPPSAALGAPPSTEETEDPLGPKEMDSAIPIQMATIMQMLPWAVTAGDTPSFTHPLLQPTVPGTLEVLSISFISQPEATPMVGPARLTDEPL